MSRNTRFQLGGTMRSQPRVRVRVHGRRIMLVRTSPFPKRGEDTLMSETRVLGERAKHCHEIPCSFNTASRMRTRITSWRVEKPCFFTNSSSPSMSDGLRRSQIRVLFMTEPQQARDRNAYADRRSKGEVPDDGPHRCISYQKIA